MNADDRERRAEEWLDAALSRYSDVQPRAGLEQRILANLDARRHARRWLRWAWIPAAAVLLLSASWWWTMRREPARVVVVETKAPPQRTENAGLNPRIIGTQPPRVPRPHLAPKAAPVAVTPLAESRQEVFPSPEPLSEQERLAIQLVRRAPQEALALAQSQAAQRERNQAPQSDTIPK